MLLDLHFIICIDAKKEVLIMLIETERLIIRDLKSEDGKVFVEMALDGSLNDIGFDENCGIWMKAWITEA